jgi:hypothetical protein
VSKMTSKFKVGEKVYAFHGHEVYNISKVHEQWLLATILEVEHGEYTIQFDGSTEKDYKGIIDLFPFSTEKELVEKLAARDKAWKIRDLTAKEKRLRSSARKVEVTYNKRVLHIRLELQKVNKELAEAESN